MKKLSAVVTTGLALLFALSANAAVVVPPNPEEIIISGVQFVGNGCPQDSYTDVQLLPDGSKFQLILDEIHHAAELLPGVQATEALKKCDITFTLNIPAGYRVAVGGIQQRGRAQLVMGARGTHRTVYQFVGQPVQQTAGLINGPFEGPYLFPPAEIKVEELAWSRCDVAQHLVIKTELGVTRGQQQLMSRARMAPPVQDAEELVGQIFQLVWDTCPVPTL